MKRLIILGCFAISFVPYLLFAKGSFIPSQRGVTASDTLLIMFIEPYYYGKVPLYSDKEKSKVSLYLQNDSVWENNIELEVSNCENGLVYCQPVWSQASLRTDSIFPKGWVSLSDHITVFMRPLGISMVRLYTEPTETSFSKLIVVTDNFKVLACYNGWVQIRVYDEEKYAYVTGWLSPDSQCPSIYGNCH